MKIKLYIVTYNNNRILNEWALDSLYNSNFDKDKVQIFIINNHSNIEIDTKFKDFVSILNNELRPDFSTGHLSRNWNQAIINGFKDLNNPDCDLVIACQNDTIFKKEWYQEVCKIVDKYKYVCIGTGDQLQIFTPQSIKVIGLYDERFCNIGYQEADYFFRALNYFNEYSAINDFPHGRTLNPLKEINIIENTEPGSIRGCDFHRSSSEYHKISSNVFKLKWGDISTDHWNSELFSKYKSPNINSFFYYPYFEKNIEEESKIIQKFIT